MKLIGVLFAISILLLVPGVVFAHCDTLDGPVVNDARAALERGDVTPALKWVKPEHESEIRSAFNRTLTVRAMGPEAKELADMYFFETLVRVHRMGEGAPYTGLKPAGTDLGPAVRAADKALETGSVDDLVKEMNAQVAEGIQERYTRTMEARKHAGESVQSGRKYAEAYVEYVHYVERLHQDTVGDSAHDESSAEAGDEHSH